MVVPFSGLRGVDMVGTISAILLLKTSWTWTVVTINAI